MEVLVINTSYGNPVKLNGGLGWKIYARNKTNLHLVFHILFWQSVGELKLLKFAKK